MRIRAARNLSIQSLLPYSSCFGLLFSTIRRLILISAIDAGFAKTAGWRQMPDIERGLPDLFVAQCDFSRAKCPHDLPAITATASGFDPMID